MAYKPEPGPGRPAVRILRNIVGFLAGAGQGRPSVIAGDSHHPGEPFGLVLQ